MFRRKKYIILPLFCLSVLVTFLYFMLKIFIKTNENLLAECLIISGGCGLIFSFIISIDSSQLVEFFIYFVYKIRKLFNKHYSKYEDPLNFEDFHYYFSSEQFVRMWFSYTLSFILLIGGIVFYKIIPVLPID